MLSALSPLWVCTFLAAAPLTEARYVFSMQHAPVGLVELQLDGPRYTYRSTHFFRDGGSRRREEQLAVTQQPAPSGLTLWLEPKRTGCVKVREELTHEESELCVDRISGHGVEGRVGGDKYSATYGADQLLQRLVIGPFVFERTTAFTVTAADPFSDGFVVAEGRGALTLLPPLEGAVPRTPTPVGQPGAMPGQCLALADAWVSEHPGSQRVLGLLVDQGRAFPHAWVRSAKGEELDPSAWLAPEKSAQTDYLALPAAQATQIYLQLLDGRRTVTRKKAAAP